MNNLNDTVAYFNGKFISKEHIAISPDDRGFLFADGLYEVMRSYEGRIFRAQDHIERLNFGARELRFNLTDFGHLIEVAEKLIRDTNLTRGDALIYIQVTRGAAPRQHRFPPPETPLTVYASARGFASNMEEQKHGLKVILIPDLRWARTNIKTVGLLPNVLAHQEARDRNAAEAIFIRDGFLMEGTHSNIFAIKNDQVLTPPLSNHILNGITRRAVLELCDELSLPHSEQPISEGEGPKADELFITGTTVEITPVIATDGRPVGSGRAGEVTRRLQEAFRKMRT
jgi:D-alanine transaminase